MKVAIYPIVSSLHDGNVINNETQNLLKEINSNNEFEFEIKEINELYKDEELTLILVQSGGSEGVFLEEFKNLKEPYYLLTHGSNNSLAASMEILSYLRDNQLKAEILHGGAKYIANRIKELSKKKTNKEAKRYGVIGKPSDWLIASKVDYSVAKELHNITLVDIDINEVISLFNGPKPTTFEDGHSFIYDEKDLQDAKRVSWALDYIKNAYCLDGLTIRCFDLLSSIKTTSCLGISLLNTNGFVGTCEGDIPSMISMAIVRNILGKSCFQANPSRIDLENSEMVFAHCTLPLDIVSSYKLDSHFESKIGVGIKGELNLGKITIFKLAKNLKDYYVTTGTILTNLDEKELCRSQIKVKVDNNIGYFLSRPYGNHHIIIYGDYEKEVKQYMDNL